MQKETDKEERNRPAAQRADDGKDGHIWTILDFGGQNLKVLTPSLFQYTFLTKLYLNSNKLTYLHQSVGQLRNLTHLDISLNNLHYLPPEIGMLVNLKQLLVFDNQLDNLPYELGSLYQLEMLGIEGNPIPDDLKQIIMEQGAHQALPRDCASPRNTPRARLDRPRRDSGSHAGNGYCIELQHPMRQVLHAVTIWVHSKFRTSLGSSQGTHPQRTTTTKRRYRVSTRD
jgi:hypothetical protein